MTMTFSPDTDFTKAVYITKVNSSGVKSPLTTGTVTGYVTLTKEPTASPANPALSVALTYTERTSGTAGIWTIAFSGATQFTNTILSALFTSGDTAYLAIQATTPVAFRYWEDLTYDDNPDLTER